MKVVLDTNILLSALGWIGNPHEVVKKIFNKQIELAVSMEIIEEFEETAREAKFEFSEEEISDYVEALIEAGDLVITTEKLEVIKDDPEDNKILECAIEAKADFIVTGDKHLLDLKEFREIRIVTAKEFLYLSTKL